MLFNSDKTKYLTAEISALEADGRGKVISSPRVMTANQIEAIIEQGVEILPVLQSGGNFLETIFLRQSTIAGIRLHLCRDFRINHHRLALADHQ